MKNNQLNVDPYLLSLRKMKEIDYGIVVKV